MIENTIGELKIKNGNIALTHESYEEKFKTFLKSKKIHLFFTD